MYIIYICIYVYIYIYIYIYMIIDFNVVENNWSFLQTVPSDKDVNVFTTVWHDILKTVSNENCLMGGFNISVST